MNNLPLLWWLAGAKDLLGDGYGAYGDGENYGDDYGDGDGDGSDYGDGYGDSYGDGFGY